MADGSSTPAPMTDAPVAVVAGHGDVAAGLVSAVQQITGRGALLLPVTNRGLGAAEVEARIRAAAASPTVVALFTDLPGGSCTIAARRVQRDRPDLALVVGVSLPALLDFVCGVEGACVAPPHGDAPHDAPAADRAAAVRTLAARAAERGRMAMALLEPPTAARATAAPSGTNDAASGDPRGA